MLQDKDGFGTNQDVSKKPSKHLGRLGASGRVEQLTPVSISKALSEEPPPLAWNKWKSRGMKKKKKHKQIFLDNCMFFKENAYDFHSQYAAL